jgi:hypothetical protein
MTVEQLIMALRKERPNSIVLLEAGGDGAVHQGSILRIESDGIRVVLSTESR